MNRRDITVGVHHLQVVVIDVPIHVPIQFLGVEVGVRIEAQLLNQELCRVMIVTKHLLIGCRQGMLIFRIIYRPIAIGIAGQKYINDKSTSGGCLAVDQKRVFARSQCGQCQRI